MIFRKFFGLLLNIMNEWNHENRIQFGYVCLIGEHIDVGGVGRPQPVPLQLVLGPSSQFAAAVVNQRPAPGQLYSIPASYRSLPADANQRYRIQYRRRRQNHPGLWCITLIYLYSLILLPKLIIVTFFFLLDVIISILSWIKFNC